MQRPGASFSIFEIAISVGITAVLLAVLIPFLWNARVSAQRARCSDNLVQLGEAWSAYLADNDDRFPHLTHRPGWSYGGVRHSRATGSWFLDLSRPLNKYVDAANGACFACPGDCGTAHEDHGATGATFDIFGTSYRLNANLVDARIAGVGPSGRGLSRSELGAIPASRMLLLGDAVWYEQYERTGRDADWHGVAGHGNLLFLDGSVQFRQIDPRGTTGPVVVEVGQSRP